MRTAKTALALAAVLSLAACENDPYLRTKTGAGVGAAAGAAIGYGIGDSTASTVIGAVGGAIIGGAVGNYMDKQQQEFEQALVTEQQQHDLEIERMRDDTLKLSVNNEVSFDFGRYNLKPAFYPTLDKLGELMRKYDRTVVHVIGHTDSIGSNSDNQLLSERRARSVGDYLANRGVAPARLRTQGRGETEPRAGNDDESGRQLNRRVELYVKPVVEGQEQRAFETPQYL